MSAAGGKGLDCLGLAQQWEQDSELRQRIRTEKSLLKNQDGEEFCAACRLNAVQNAMVLRPVLVRMREQSRRLPHLDDLKVEVETVYEKCGHTPGDKLVYTSSVEVKRLTSFIKRRVQRKEVTKDLGIAKPNLILNFILNIQRYPVKFVLCYLYCPFMISSTIRGIFLVTSVLFVCSAPASQDTAFHELLLLLDPDLKDQHFQSGPNGSLLQSLFLKWW
jgi:hypothetical protein